MAAEDHRDELVERVRNRIEAHADARAKGAQPRRKSAQPVPAPPAAFGALGAPTALTAPAAPGAPAAAMGGPVQRGLVAQHHGRTPAADPVPL